VSDIEPHVEDATTASPVGAGGARDGRRRGGRGRRGIVLLVWLAVIAVVALGMSMIVDTTWPLTFAALLLGAVILRTGWFFLQSFATPPPPPPEPGTLRKVKLTYRCEVCGAELRMTMAATEDPEPPRHCMEEMELVANAEL
jgi:hypothetical protein